MRVTKCLFNKSENVRLMHKANIEVRVLETKAT